MFKIQITGKSGGELDVMTGTTAPLNLSASDIRKPAEKKGTWSKTITLAATSNNGQKLGYHFNVNVEKATFDVNKKLAVGLLENEVELEGYFFLQLLAVNKKRGRVVSYDAVVKDEVSDFFTIINGRYLTDLDYSDDNHFLTAANVAAKFSATAATSNYKYHLTMNDNELFDISQFKPAFFLKPMWDRIHQRAAKSYEWAGMNDTDVQFPKWLIPSNVDKAESDTSPLVVATNALWLRQKTGAGVPPQLFLENFVVSTEVLDVANLYDPSTGNYTSPVVVNAGSAVVFNLKFRYQMFIKNNAPNNATLTSSLSGGGQLSFVPRVYVLKNGSAITQALIPVTGFPNPGVGTTIAPGGTFNVMDSVVNFSVSVSGFNAGDILNLTQTLQQLYLGVSWIDQITNAPASMTHNILITDIEMSVSPNAGNGYEFGEWVNMNKFIPQKVKQSEVVAAVMTLNNLIVDKEKSTPSKIVYTKRDAYLDAGAVKDWSLKIDQGQEHDITFIPDLTAKRHILTYKEDKDAANVGYQENTHEIYGQQEYTFKSEFAKEVETTEIVFSPTPCAQLNFGAVVPLYSGKTPGCNIRLLFDGGIKPCAPYRIRNYPGNELQITTGYPYVGHFDDPVTPKLDLNFGLCDYYFYPLQTFTNRNMFNLNWRRTMNQIDNGRMLTGMFNLDEYDVKTLRLNDKIFCENEYWNINKVIDYDPNNNGLTKVELISVDDLLKIPTRTIIKPGVKEPTSPTVVSPGVAVGNPVKEVVKRVNSGLNSVPGTGEVLILGKGNIVDQAVRNAIVLGDDQTIEKDGIYTPMLKVTGEDPAELCGGIVTSAITACDTEIEVTAEVVMMGDSLIRSEFNTDTSGLTFGSAGEPNKTNLHIDGTTGRVVTAAFDGDNGAITLNAKDNGTSDEAYVGMNGSGITTIGAIGGGGVNQASAMFDGDTPVTIISAYDDATGFQSNLELTALYASLTNPKEVSLGADKISFFAVSELSVNNAYLLPIAAGAVGQVLRMVSAGVADWSTFAVSWGDITGSLSAQTDLQTALNGKQPLSTILTALAALDATTGIVVQSGASSFVKRQLTAPAAGLTISNANGVAGNPTLALANDLAALEAMGGFGIAVRIAADTWTVRAVVPPAAGLSISNQAGIAGDITIALANDLAALEALASTGFAVRTAADTWAQRQLVAPAAGFTITNPAGIAGNPTFVLSDDLQALENLAVTGIIVRTATNVWTSRTITGTAGQIDVTNGNGVSGNPTLSLDNEIVIGSSVFRPASSSVGIRTKGAYGWNDAPNIYAFAVGGRSALLPNLANGICSAVLGGAWNTATGQYDTVTGGYNNTVNGSNSAAVGGTSANVTGINGVAIGGDGPTVSGSCAVTLGGINPQATTDYSTAQGMYALTTNMNERAHGMTQKTQSGTVMAQVITTNTTTVTMLGADGVAGLSIPVGESWLLSVDLQATITSVTNRGSSRGWYWKVRVKNIAGVMTATLVQPEVSDAGDTGITAVGLITTNAAGGKYNIRVAGPASTTVQWIARIDYTKTIFI